MEKGNMNYTVSENRIKASVPRKIFVVFNYAFLTLFAIVCLLPEQDLLVRAWRAEMPERASGMEKVFQLVFPPEKGHLIS